MRHWFFLVGVLLFVAGIGFVDCRRPGGPAGVRWSRRRSHRPRSPRVKQIMKGIVAPAATVVFNSVSTTVSIRGTEEKVPAQRRGVGGRWATAPRR